MSNVLVDAGWKIRSRGFGGCRPRYLRLRLLGWSATLESVFLSRSAVSSHTHTPSLSQWLTGHKFRGVCAQRRGRGAGFVQLRGEMTTKPSLRSRHETAAM